MSEKPDALVERVRDALRIVIDPELGYNIVDLGLVYSVEAAGGGLIDILMTTTMRGCPATSYLRDGARDGAWAVPGVEFVTVTLTYEPHWQPEMMTDEAKQHLGFA